MVAFCLNKNIFKQVLASRDENLLQRATEVKELLQQKSDVDARVVRERETTIVCC